MTGTFIVLAAWKGLSGSMRTSALAIERPEGDGDLGTARGNHRPQGRLERTLRRGEHRGQQEHSGEREAANEDRCQHE